MAERPLTGKENDFVKAFVAGSARGNVTAAARAAGYVNPQAHGCEVRHRPRVAAEIARIYQQQAIGQDELLAVIGSTARAEYASYFRVDGGRLVVDLEALLADGKGHLIKGVKETEFGQQIEFVDSQQAQALAARVLGLLNQQPQEPTRDESIGAALDRKLAGLAAALGAEPVPGEPLP